MSRIFIGLAAALAMASTTAYAATSSISAGDAAEACTKLNAQFTYLEPFKEGLPYWTKAAQAHKSGVQDCKAGNATEGAQLLQTAISDLYVKPDVL